MEDRPTRNCVITERGVYRGPNVFQSLAKLIVRHIFIVTSILNVRVTFRLLGFIRTN